VGVEHGSQLSAHWEPEKQVAFDPAKAFLVCAIDDLRDVDETLWQGEELAQNA